MKNKTLKFWRQGHLRIDKNRKPNEKSKKKSRKIEKIGWKFNEKLGGFKIRPKNIFCSKKVLAENRLDRKIG